LRKVTCFAVFEPSTEGTFGVYFPDLPGCSPKHGERSVGLHLWGKEKDGDNILEPSQPPFEREKRTSAFRTAQKGQI